MDIFHTQIQLKYRYVRRNSRRGRDRVKQERRVEARPLVRRRHGHDGDAPAWSSCRAGAAPRRPTAAASKVHVQLGGRRPSTDADDDDRARLLDAAASTDNIDRLIGVNAQRKCAENYNKMTQQIYFSKSESTF